MSEWSESVSGVSGMREWGESNSFRVPVRGQHRAPDTAPSGFLFSCCQGTGRRLPGGCPVQCPGETRFGLASLGQSQCQGRRVQLCADAAARVSGPGRHTGRAHLLLIPPSSEIQNTQWHWHPDISGNNKKWLDLSKLFIRFCPKSLLILSWK